MQRAGSLSWVFGQIPHPQTQWKWHLEKSSKKRRKAKACADFMGWLSPYDLFTSAVSDYCKSNLSSSITLVQALAKSSTKRVLPSSAAYTSATALSSEWEPNTKSTGVAVHLSLPD